VSVTVDGISVLSCALVHPVDASDDAIAGCWRVADDERDKASATPRRLVLITLSKKVTVPGLTVWWSQVREGDAPIDVGAITNRKQTASGQSFQQVRVLQ
jgi:hypothetical protein